MKMTPRTASSWVAPLALLAVLCAATGVAQAQEGTAAPAAQAQAGPDPHKALELLKAGKHAEAEAEFRSVLAVEKHSQWVQQNKDWVHYMLGLALQGQGKNDEAEANLRSAYELKSTFEYARALAALQLQNKQADKALALLAEAEPLASAEERQALHSLRGYALLSQGKTPEAMAEFEKSVAVKKSAPLLVQLGKYAYSKGEVDKAAAALAEAVALEPSDADNLLLLANVKLAMALKAEQPDTRNALYAEVLDLATRYSAIRNDAEGANLVGRAALNLGKHQEAEQAFLKVLQAKPDSCAVMGSLGRLYTEQERWADAERQLVAATRCDPQQSAYFETLGFVYLNQNKVQDALEAYTKANTIKPSPSAQEGITAARNRMEAQATAQVSNRESAEYEAARRKAEREYQEYLKKRQEWEKKRQESN